MSPAKILSVDEQCPVLRIYVVILNAITMTEGDPSWAGVLAGVALGLPVYHVTEDEVKSQVDPDIYDEEIGIAEMVLEIDEIRESAKSVRDRVAAATT